MGIRRFPAIFLAATLAMNSGCGTVFYGKWDTVNVTCNQPSAVLTIDAHEVRGGPIKLKRADVHLIRAELDGYKTAACFIDNKYIIWALIVDICFVVPWVVDAMTGDYYHPVPQDINLVLEKDPDYQPSPAARGRLPSPASLFCNCGFKVAADGRCPNCGGTTTQSSPPPPPASSQEAPSIERTASERKFCSSCGAKLDAGQKFCPSCGAATK
jgi:hypothetical protein